MKVSWKDGRLAAKQLFDALAHCKIPLENCRFDNVFIPVTDGPEVVCKNALRRIRNSVKNGLTVVAMGKKVEKALKGRFDLAIVHPAARGKIRKKARYFSHVMGILNEV